MEPLVTNLFKFSILFQTGVLIINDVYKFLVISYYAQFTRRNVYVTESKAVNLKFFDLLGQRYGTPDKIFVSAVAYAGKSLFGRQVTYMEFKS